MSECPKCATEVQGDGECPICGATPPSHRCTRCGETFGDTDACPACGQAAEPFQCESHPEEVALGRCVVCGRALCRDCHSGESRAFLCEQHGGVTVIQGWAQIYTTTREFEAQLLRDNLGAEGIEARIFSQRDNMLSVDLGDLSIVRLLVPVWEYEPALGLIREHMDEVGEISFACPECGEVFEPGSESCSSCGAALMQVPE